MKKIWMSELALLSGHPFTQSSILIFCIDALLINHLEGNKFLGV